MVKIIFTKLKSSPYFLATLASCLIVFAALLIVLFKPGDILFSDVTEGISRENIVNRYFETYDDNLGESLVEQSRIPIFSFIWTIFDMSFLPLSWFIKIKLLLLYCGSIMAFIISIKILSKYIPTLATNPTTKQKHISNKWLIIILIAGSLIYVFNPWMTNRITHFFLFFASVNIPLVFALYFDLLMYRRLRITRLLILALVIAATIATPHTVIFDLFIMTLCTIVFALTKGRSGLKRIASIIYFTGFLVVFLSLFWVFPYLASQGAVPDRAETLDIFNLLSRNADPLNAFRLMGYWWINTNIYFSQLTVIKSIQLIGSFVLPVFFLSFCYFYRKTKLVYILIVMAIVGLFLASSSSLSNAFYEYLIFYSPLQSLGWLFREIDKFGIVLVFVYSISLVLLWARIVSIERPFRVWAKLLFLLIIPILLTAYGVFAGSHLYYVLKTNYKPQTVPDEFYEVNDLIATKKTVDNLDYDLFNVVWYPGVSDPTWSDTKDNPHALADSSSSQPIFNTSSGTNYLVNYLLDDNNVQEIDLGKSLSYFGIKYLIIRNDDPNYSQQELIDTLKTKPELNNVYEKGFLTVFENLLYHGITNAYSNQVQTNLGLEIFKHLDDLNIEPSNTAINFLDTKDSALLNLPTAAYIMVNNDPLDIILSKHQSEFIFPADYSIRSKPDAAWSKASLKDITHIESHFYLEEQEINNSQLDYDNQVIIAEDGWQLKEIIQEKSIFTDPSKQIPLEFDKLSTVSIRNNSQSQRFDYYFDPTTETNPFWKIVRSNRIERSNTQALAIRFSYKFKHDITLLEPHAKISYYDSDSKEIKTQHLIPDIHQKVFTIDRIPENAVSYDISFWTAVTSTAYSASVTDFQLVNATDYVEPIKLSFQDSDEALCQDSCEIYVRVLENTSGGEVSLRMNGHLFVIPTHNATNRFNWINAGNISLNTTDLNLEIVNESGFNAVNSILLIDPDRFEKTALLVNTDLDNSSVIIPDNSSDDLSIFTNQMSIKTARKSSSIYKLNLTNDFYEPVFLIDLKKPFDPSWRLEFEDSYINSTLQINGFSNGWLIDNGTVLEDKKHLTIFYYPQRFFVFGAAISAFTAFFVLIFLYVRFHLLAKHKERI